MLWRWLPESGNPGKEDRIRSNPKVDQQLCSGLQNHSGQWLHPCHEDAMPIVIQSRSHAETDWRNEVWRRTRDEAYVLAKCKANLTGRIYRLVNDQGKVIEEVRHLGSSFGRSAD
jgi:hypothetical protein